MFATALVLALLPAGTPAQQEELLRRDGAPRVRYELLEGSTIRNLLDLGPGLPTHPVRGSFVLEKLPTLAPFDAYRLSRLWLHTLDPLDPSAGRIRGGGFYHSFGPFPDGAQQLNLVVEIGGEGGIQLASGVVPKEARFPTIDVTAREAGPNGSHQYVLHLVAQPRMRLAFSTGADFTSARLGPISAGDMLSSRGRILRTNGELTRFLGIQPPAPDIGLDALGLTPATERVLFSGRLDVFSETLGALQNGDLLNEDGFVARTNQELLAAFGPQPPAPDAGLDAFHADLRNGELWFSLAEPVFSETLGVVLQAGDLLSDAGYVVRTNGQLLERFDFLGPQRSDYGLDAVTVQPNGTILFSIEQGFPDARYGWVAPGDLLSDDGHVIRRNQELVRRFEPLEDLDDFGLDALQIGSR